MTAISFANVILITAIKTEREPLSLNSSFKFQRHDDSLGLHL